MPSFRDGAYRYWRWLTDSAHSHFGLGLKILPKPKRRAMEAVYAFCRAVDDVVDLGDQAAAKRELDLWRRELETCQKGCATHPITVALQEAIRHYEIPMAHFEAILSGVEMDLTKKRYANFGELQLYCEPVAAAVGLTSIRIFGCRHPASQRYANALGIALQLTNILRDIQPDRARGRVYLPQEELARFGLSEESLKDGNSSESFQRFMAFQVERAKEFFQQAAQARRESREGRILIPAQIMAGVYRRLLSRIEELHYDVLAHQVSVPRGEQLRIALKCLMPLS
jgi:phytoene synthase